MLAAAAVGAAGRWQLSKICVQQLMSLGPDADVLAHLLLLLLLLLLLRHQPTAQPLRQPAALLPLLLSPCFRCCC
jgi:hypothetical protein